MRTALCTLLTCGLMLGAASGIAADKPAANRTAADKPTGGKPQLKLEHPSNVALVEGTKPGDLVYKHFPSNLRLYIFDKDGQEKSACNDPCTSSWPPLIVPTGDARTVGDWKPFKRDDGRLQWAYKGHPVYIRYHDSPEKPMGDGVDGTWHLLNP
jgi:predicted lipoprotein with Yx(FWY)xxD motif